MKDVTPNEVLGDVMIEDQYNSDGDDLVKEEDKKKKSVAFKASSSSKNNGKSKKESSDEQGLWCKKEKRSHQEQRICEKML